MKWGRLICVLMTLTVALAGRSTAADEHGRGHGRDRDDEGERHERRFSRHDRRMLRDWHRDHEEGLPPGLAKRDYLPPGLERQLRVRGTLPPGLQGYVHPCPVDLERQLPPPPPDCEHVIIGGHLVLLNRRTSVILDIFHFER